MLRVLVRIQLGTPENDRTFSEGACVRDGSFFGLGVKVTPPRVREREGWFGRNSRVGGVW